MKPYSTPWYFGEFGGVNPSISDSSTYTFLTSQKMQDMFEGNADGCYLYSRHSSPSNIYLEKAMAKLELTEASQVFASGMGAISASIMQLCEKGSHIIASRTIYGGTYALMKNVLPNFGVNTSFVDITDVEAVEQSITVQTKIIYCETVSNPLLEVADLKKLGEIAKKHGLQLIIDNTFSPLSIRPAEFGASIVIHSLTKYINGSSDCLAGVVCASEEFCASLRDVNTGCAMLFGSTLDSFRAASIYKNINTLGVRMQKHSANALYLAEKLEEGGYRAIYPGLASHPDHNLMTEMIDPLIGYSGMLTLDVHNKENAYNLMEDMQAKELGLLAVSLGYHKTLFSAPANSTSSEIPVEEQEEMGMTDGLIRFSIGLDLTIEHTTEEILKSLKNIL